MQRSLLQGPSTQTSLPTPAAGTASAAAAAANGQVASRSLWGCCTGRLMKAGVPQQSLLALQLLLVLMTARQG